MSLALISDIETISDWIIDGAVLSGCILVYSRPHCTLILCAGLNTMACCMSVHRGILATRVTSHIYKHCQETYVKWTYSYGPIGKAYIIHVWKSKYLKERFEALSLSVSTFGSRGKEHLYTMQHM